jgi:pimeloyl-ACP methyl ester carboxylesterase
MGHGSTESMYNDAWAIAPQLAAAGIATAAIHYAGHGGGERGTLEVESRDGRVVVVPSGGRGIDQDGDGRISPLEGLYATPPKAIVFSRDGTRQTVIDLMQLVREIQAGVDVEGDGHVDLDAMRITYVGHSAGANYGTVLMAIEPSIGAGALICPGGSGVDVYRLGVRGTRRIIGGAMAARTPSLLNGPVADDAGKPSLEFTDSIPLRNQSVAIQATPGAMEIQQLFDRMSWVSQLSNPVAYAPYLRGSPLPGHPTKRVLVQFAKGDRSVTNPTTTALIRAGQLTDRTILYRADLAQTSDPRGMPKNPHNFLLDGVDTAERPFALAAQRQIVIFLKTAGVQTVDPESDGPVFETPIKGPLPEDLGFLL